MNAKLLNLRWILRLPLLVTMVFSLMQPTAAYAADIVVNTLDKELNSDGDCSLREAVEAANTNIAVDACPAGDAAGTDTITFAVSGTIGVTDQLEVTGAGPLVIDGGGAITLTGGDYTDLPTPVMYIDPGAEVTVRDLTITGGQSSGIVNAGSLALAHSTLSGNSAGIHGGGIKNIGTLTISDSTLSGNQAGNNGGGIYNNGTLIIADSTLSGNFASGEGGAIDSPGLLTISDSTLSGNQADSNGGGISSVGALTITNSTVSTNYANLDGGGIDSSGPLTLTDSTVSGNHSQRFGGGLSSYGTSTITDSTVSGNTAYRFGGAMINGGTTTITDSTLSNNGGDFGVGGILNFATLTLSHSSMDGNYAYGECGGSFNTGTLTVMDDSHEGSGICNVGTLAVSNSTLGGIFNAEGTEILGIMFEAGPGIATITNSTLSGSHISNVGTLHVTHSTVSGSFGSQGGGIYNATYVQVAGYGSWGRGILTLTDSTVSGNSASQGGGIFNLGTLDVTGSTLSGNVAYGEGGGIYNTQTVEVDGIPISGPGVLTLTNSTLSNNSASQSGGIHNSGTLTVRNSTLSGNHIEQYSTGYDGRGGSITNDAGTVTLYSSILAYTPSGVHCDGAIIDAGYNIEDEDSCSLVPANGSLTNADPLLGPLEDNGGPTQTHALLPASPAIDTGDPLNCPATDQRGVSRPLDGDLDGTAICDMGAYELGIVATIDITPTIINLPSKGTWMTAYIELPHGFHVAAIHLSTVRLQGTIPAANQRTKVGDHDKDGNPDIMVQFSQQALITQLGGVRGEVTLLVTGRLGDGTPFEGRDTIFVGRK